MRADIVRSHQCSGPGGRKQLQGLIAQQAGPDKPQGKKGSHGLLLRDHPFDAVPRRAETWIEHLAVPLALARDTQTRPGSQQKKSSRRISMGTHFLRTSQVSTQFANACGNYRMREKDAARWKRLSSSARIIQLGTVGSLVSECRRGCFFV